MGHKAVKEGRRTAEGTPLPCQRESAKVEFERLRIAQSFLLLSLQVNQFCSHLASSIPHLCQRQLFQQSQETFCLKKQKKSKLGQDKRKQQLPVFRNGRDASGQQRNSATYSAPLDRLVPNFGDAPVIQSNYQNNPFQQRRKVLLRTIRPRDNRKSPKAGDGSGCPRLLWEERLLPGRAQRSSSPVTFLSNYKTLRSIIMLICWLVVVEKCN